MIYSDRFRDAAVQALILNDCLVRSTAADFRIHHSTLVRWAKARNVTLPSAKVRMTRGHVIGNHRQWGDWEARRAEARRLAQEGKLLREISTAVGYKSLSAAHYAKK